MTHTERTRFIILIILLILLIALGFAVNRFQSRSRVGADVLGIIDNQAAATFESSDGIQFTSLSDISHLTVSSGVNNLVISYSLGSRVNQNAKFDIQFFHNSSGQLVATLRDLSGQNGVLKAQAKNIPNGTYDIAVKPIGYLSQAKKAVAYANGTPTTLDFTTPFAWGDIDSSHAGRGDNIVNNADWAILLAAFNGNSPLADYNADGIVNGIDASVMLANWGPPGERFQSESLDATPSAPPQL